MAAWKEYIPAVVRPRANDALAIVGRGKQIRITPAAVEALGNPTHVVLLFDKIGRRVALRASQGEESYSFPLKRYGGGKVSTISAEGFLRWAEIDHSERREFRVQKLTDRTVAFQLCDGADDDGEFTEFRLKGAALSHQAPNVSISRNGNLTLNRPAMELIRDAGRVVLLFDDEDRRIGLRPAADESHARPARPSSGQRTWTISAEGFLKQFGVVHSEGRSYEPTEQDGVLVIDLNRPKPPRQTRRRPEELAHAG